MNRALLFLPLAVFGFMAILFFAVEKDIADGEYRADAMPSALTGRPFPEFQLVDLNGEAISKVDMPLKPTLVNVWATWCPTCLYEHPYLMELAKRDDIALVGINYKDNVGKAKDWLAKRGDPFVLNIVDKQGRLGLDLGVTGAPETYVVDRMGTIRMRHQGEINEKVWNERFAPLIDTL